MADKQEKTEPEALIDYAADNSTEWSGSDLRAYWRDRLMKHHRIGGRLWTVQENTFAKRLTKEFTADDLREMIDYYILYAKEPWNFKHFYTMRREMNQNIHPKDYSWD